MLRTAVALITILASACASQPETPEAGGTGAPTIFREVEFQPFAAITLGEPLRRRTPQTVARGDLLALTEPGFGGTDSVYLRLYSDRRVAALYFVYPDTTNFSAAVASYEATLGAPRSDVTMDSASGRVQHVTWEDSATTFVMGQFVTSIGKRRISSALVDRATLR